MIRANRKLVMGLLGSGLLVGMSLWAQSPAPVPPAQGGQPPASTGSTATSAGTQVDPIVAPTTAVYSPFGAASFPSAQGSLSTTGNGFNFATRAPSSPMQKAAEKMSQAKVALKKSNTDEEKKKANDQLDAALGEYFEADMIQRKKELADVKKKVEELEKQLSKRETAKGEIIDLQRKVIASELNGMGFYGSSPNSAFGSTSGFYDSGRYFVTPPSVPTVPAPAINQKK